MDKYGELKVSAPHKVGIFKYIVGHLKETSEPAPMEVYIAECQLNVTKGFDEYEDDVYSVEIKYKVNRRGKTWCVKSNEIFNTKEDVLNHIKYMNSKNDKCKS